MTAKMKHNVYVIVNLRYRYLMFQLHMTDQIY